MTNNHNQDRFSNLEKNSSILNVSSNSTSGGMKKYSNKLGI
jgi:hypothetical protein